jgi:hypothetical protein
MMYFIWSTAGVNGVLIFFLAIRYRMANTERKEKDTVDSRLELH